MLANGKTIRMARKHASTIHAVYGKTEDQYMDLIRRFPLRPLRTEADLDAAVEVIDDLIDRATLTTAEQDFLDVLSDLIEAYERETIPISPVGDAKLLRFLIEHKAVTQAEVASNAGIAESTISEVLAGKRRLNRRQIAKLARYFDLNASVFLMDS
jgi:HTH-type transcriptional regulator/antitoxin HigA